jgi:hypothetical protein
VWSVFVDGRPEKPALAEGPIEDERSREVLIKIINSTRPFDVRLIYGTAGTAIGRLGTIDGVLPNPDILVTRSRWDVFLPEGMTYGEPSSNMNLVERRNHVSRDVIEAELAHAGTALEARQAIEPLRIQVPSAGVHYAFAKLYANQRDQEASFELPYVSAEGTVAGHSISLGGAALFWLGTVLALRRSEWPRRLAALAMAGTGAVVLLLALGTYQLSATPALVLSLIVIVAGLARFGRRALQDWRELRLAD